MSEAGVVERAVRRFQPCFRAVERTDRIVAKVSAPDWVASVSDPNVVLDLRAKLEATGLFDRFEVDRVAKVAVKPKATQGELDAAITPVSLRLLTRFKAAKAASLVEPEGSRAFQAAKDEMAALVLFKGDLGTYARVYEFLGQMFDYGNTDYEKLYLFAKLLVPLLEYGRERDGVDLSALRLTHHRMRDLGQRQLNLGAEDAADKLKPVTDAGSGAVQDKQKKRLEEIIAALSGLFGDGLTEGDLVSFQEAVERKMMESDVLRNQAAANTRLRTQLRPPDEDSGECDGGVEVPCELVVACCHAAPILEV
jgi:type I restriction enzyme R subunit